MAVLTTEIAEILKADSTLLALLGNPAASPFNIHFESPPPVPDLPFIVYDFQGAGRIEDVESIVVVRPHSVTVRSYAADELACDAIAERIVVLLHQVPIEGAWCMYVRMVGKGREARDLSTWARIDEYELIDRRDNS